MIERPILMSAPMVNVTLEDRKTNTRRTRGLEIINKDPNAWVLVMCGALFDRYHATFQHVETGDRWTCACPYGQSGDRLWVRETWRQDNGIVQYRADTGNHGPSDGSADAESRNWRPSIFMPRAVSRITLEVVGVRVERVQDISEEDAIAEGCVATAAGDGYPFAMPARMNFVDLWDSINLKRGFGWAVDPWVWPITFKRIA